jgi:hypothetical protein
MQPDTQTPPVSKKMLWAGRTLRAIPVLFLLFDAVAKLIKPASSEFPTNVKEVVAMFDLNPCMCHSHWRVG